VDKRFGKVDLSITAPQHSGQLTAFYRPAPRRQEAYSAVCQRVLAGEFRKQRALIIGGSRGLGEVFAKTVAAGSGEVVITYRSGKQDAEAVVADIADRGGAARALRLDVLEVEDWPRPFLSGAPTHLYYLATPPIFVGSRMAHSESLEQEFRAYYVDALQSAAAAYRDCRPFTVVAPSSVAVADTPLGMEEYANAKRALESWATSWTTEHPHHRVICDRYPRLATDQTQSNALVEALDPLEFVLERVREAHRP
jgi:NAD(P)-dependent dehydrogenase (short-subunit alcohol dehydrogenase family)